MKFGGKKRGLTWMLCGLMLLCMRAGAEQSAMQAEISDEMQIDSAREIEDLQAWAQEEITDEMLLPEVDRQAELAAAKEKNEDTVAWLYIPGVEVDEAVVQGEDNGYYLYLNAEGEYDGWGCYYADCRNHLGSRAELDLNTVIYGHAAGDCDPDGPKFTKLHRFMDAEYVAEHPYIYLSVDGENLVFQIAACFITDTAFDYINPNPEGEEADAFFDAITRKNWLCIEGAALGAQDRILTLSSCCRKYDAGNAGNQRLVVMAKLLDEEATVFNAAVEMAENPEMP